MVILEQNFKWHLEAFASELFNYSGWYKWTYIINEEKIILKELSYWKENLIKQLGSSWSSKIFL